MSHIITWYVWQLRLTLTSSSTPKHYKTHYKPQSWLRDFVMYLCFLRHDIQPARDVLLQAQEERANVAHKAYQLRTKERDDAYKAGAIWAQQVTEARKTAEKAVLGHTAAKQASMAALKDAEVCCSCCCPQTDGL